MSMSLKHITEKIKSFYTKSASIVFYTLLFFLLFYMFILLLKLDFSIGIEDTDTVLYEFDENLNLQYIKYKDSFNLNNKNTNIIASKNGSKYYFANCTGVNRIKEENRVYFLDEKEAIEAGYELAKNCSR